MQDSFFRLQAWVQSFLLPFRSMRTRPETVAKIVELILKMPSPVGFDMDLPPEIDLSEFVRRVGHSHISFTPEGRATLEMWTQVTYPTFMIATGSRLD